MTSAVPDRLLSMTAFLDEFRSTLVRKREAQTQHLAAFLRQYRSCLANSSSADRFNVLDVSGVGNDEVKHSSILAWLFTPHGSHACGTRFLSIFLKAAGISVPEKDLANCYVRTEFCGDESIVDILVCKPAAFLVYVENKTLSAEGVEQVDREFRDMVRVGRSVRVPRDKMFPVFLSPWGRLPTSGNPEPWHAISYGQFARKLEELLPSLTGRKIAFLVEDLIEQYYRWSNV